MPLYWTIDSRERLMTAVAEGGVAKEEADAYLDAMIGARAGPYRRLFDGSHGEPLMSAEDIMAIAVRMRSIQELMPSGPLAIVMPAALYQQFARMLGILAIPERPMRFFADSAAARAWLNEPNIRHWGEDAGDPPLSH
jgi:hypothetical protein